MHDAAFASAARQSRYVILGLPMKPYSIGHEILLYNQGNQMLSTGLSSLPVFEQRQAIIRAALVCSQSWNENQKPQRWLKLWRWKNRKADYSLARADFLNYRRDGTIFPPTPDPFADLVCNGEEKKGRAFGSPYLARLYNFVSALPDREIFNHGDSAFDFPFALANFLYLTKLEQDGELKIENSAELEEKENVARIRAEVAAEKEAEKCQH